ncbi:unnamed protein product [Chondrus crispus]|uniref:Uncharacterized protein n=1 Tax=Chondrus crispus TaxID=2769 RepID=R7QUH8_CHOCR|nr:unnamed protein product [Chondrus crispus]CDF41136.1 unnamed protein product [Chondrus crispus]|eukprot:XP_005711430.1 unnamed protein product [Chondrus crispus]
MARTKQTAAKSTRGKRPRKRLALKAARFASRDHLMFELSSRADVTKVPRRAPCSTFGWPAGIAVTL